MSISEFDPGRDVSDASLNLLGWLIEWFLLKQVSPKFQVPSSKSKK
jgi:hypothetical protein